VNRRTKHSACVCARARGGCLGEALKCTRERMRSCARVVLPLYKTIRVSVRARARGGTKEARESVTKNRVQTGYLNGQRAYAQIIDALVLGVATE
jgi:hypothetical protein